MNRVGWCCKLLVATLCLTCPGGCTLLHVTKKFRFHNVLLIEIQNVPSDQALLAFESDQPIYFSNFDTTTNRPPTTCWDYMPFQAGPSVIAHRNGEPDAKLTIFALPPGSYTVHAYPGFYKTEGLARLSNAWLTFTLKSGDRLFLGTTIESAGSVQASTQSLHLAIDPELHELGKQGFKFGDQIRLHTEPKAPPPACGVGL
jgi:hypothetical protein